MGFNLAFKGLIEVTNVPAAVCRGGDKKVNIALFMSVS